MNKRPTIRFCHNRFFNHFHLDNTDNCGNAVQCNVLEALIRTVLQSWETLLDGGGSNILICGRWYLWQLGWDSNWVGKQSKYWHHFWQIWCDNNWVAICTVRQQILKICVSYFLCHHPHWSLDFQRWKRNGGKIELPAKVISCAGRST